MGHLIGRSMQAASLLISEALSSPYHASQRLTPMLIYSFGVCVFPGKVEPVLVKQDLYSTIMSFMVSSASSLQVGIKTIHQNGILQNPEIRIPGFFSYWKYVYKTANARKVFEHHFKRPNARQAISGN